MFVDSDDWVNEEFCRKAFEAVQKNKAQMAIFDLAYTVGDSRNGNIHRSFLDEGVYPMETVLKERLVGNITVYLWNKIYIKKLWDGILFPVGEIWEDDAVLHEVIDRAEKIVILHDVLYYKLRRQGSIAGTAFLTGEWAKWVYIQRRKRYIYLKEHHPEMMHIECNVMAAVALNHARFLTKSKNGLPEVRNISKWLHIQEVHFNKGSIKRKTAYCLLLNYPAIFYYLVKSLVRFKIIKE